MQREKAVLNQLFLRFRREGQNILLISRGQDEADREVRVRHKTLVRKCCIKFCLVQQHVLVEPGIGADAEANCTGNAVPQYGQTPHQSPPLSNKASELYLMKPEVLAGYLVQQTACTVG